MLAVQAHTTALAASLADAHAATAEASARAVRAEEQLGAVLLQLEEQRATAEGAQALAAQLREELRASEGAAARKLDSERAVRRAAEDELVHTRSELERLQAMLGGAHAAAAAAGAAGAWGGGGGGMHAPPAGS
jgi:chromosome segregation ATPase